MITQDKDLKFDKDLDIEVYQFTDLSHTFPEHFHDYYVMGLIESGERDLRLNSRMYKVPMGSVIFFNPMDNHSCEQTSEENVRYRCINVDKDVMTEYVLDIFGEETPPHFREPVVDNHEISQIFLELHERLLNGADALEKEELFMLFLEQAINTYADLEESSTLPRMRKEIEDVCAYIEDNFDTNVSLEKLGEIAGLNKYTLLRTFTRYKAITPYRYLENIRITRAKKLLESGAELRDTALETGFSDQSHFIRYFTKFMGLTPKQYQSIFRENTQ